MMRSTNSVVCFTLLAAAGGACAQGIAEGYTLIELTPAKETTVTRANAINNRGQIAGSVGDILGLPIDATLPIRWNTPSQPENIDPNGSSLGASTAFDINDQGLVRAFDADDSINYVRGPDGASYIFFANDGTPSRRINAVGNVSGFSLVDPSINEVVQFDINKAGAMLRQFEGSFVVETGRGIRSTVMSDAGFLVAGLLATDSAAFIVVDTRSLQGTEFVGIPGRFVEFTTAIDVNDRAQFIGTVREVTALTYGVIGDRAGTVLTLPAIGCPAGQADACAEAGATVVRPMGMNEFGTVVGSSARIVGSGAPFSLDGRAAFAWTPADGAVELGARVKDGSADGWTLDEATDINDAGWIVGNGINPLGQARAFLLVPRSPCAADTNRDGLVTPADYNAWILAFNNGCD